MAFLQSPPCRPRIWNNTRTREGPFVPSLFPYWSAKAVIESRGLPTVTRFHRMMIPSSRTEPPAVQRQKLISSHDGTLPGPFEFLLTTIASPGRFSHVSLSGVLFRFRAPPLGRLERSMKVATEIRTANRTKANYLPVFDLRHNHVHKKIPPNKQTNWSLPLLTHQVIGA